MCLNVCMYFQVLAQLGGCSNSSREEIKGSGGGYGADQYSGCDAFIRFTHLGGLKRIKLPNYGYISRSLSPTGC